MSTYYETDMGAGAMTTQQLDRIALEHNGRLGSHGYGYGCNKVISALAGGWSARWIATRGMGNYGDLVLQPGDRRTRALWREGKVRHAMGYGLSRCEAERLLNAYIRHALEEQVMAPLGEILADQGMVAAWCRHPGYGPDAGRADWWRAYGNLAPEMARHLSAPREHALACAVRACVAYT
jgi:hypothetical protein